MMNKKGLRTKVSSIFFWTVLIVSFLFFAAVIEFKANGWQFNFQTKKLIKTGMISLDGTPDTSQVLLNGKNISNLLPAKIRDLAPGYYDIMVTSPGYKSWQKTVQIVSAKANIFQYIVLFKDPPTEAMVPQDLTSEVIQAEFKTKSANILIQNSEIFWQGQFVTRFGQNVLGAIIYPDNNHIIFQQENEIRVIDIDGSNNQLLFNLSSSDQTFFTTRNSGRTIFYLDGGQVYGKTIN
jgi:hypothetical protein